MTPKGIFVCSFSPLKAKAFSQTQLPGLTALQSEVRGLPFKASLLHWKHWERALCQQGGKIRLAGGPLILHLFSPTKAPAMPRQITHSPVNVDTDIWGHWAWLFHLRSDPCCFGIQQSPFSHHQDTNLSGSSCTQLSTPQELLHAEEGEGAGAATTQNPGSEGVTCV